MRLETTVADARPGRVLLDQTPFYPGGGGQLPDKGFLRWANGEAEVSGFDYIDGAIWHVLATPVEIQGAVEAVVDADFREMMRELHTGTHILNAYVFQTFNGALVTGVQMNDDGTARMDFDIPAADNNVLRGLESPINQTIQHDLAVRCVYIPFEEAKATHGLIRSRSVAPPPTADGMIRIVDIDKLDRQACGGTHLERTGAMRQIKILKIDNKGRHNRRVRMGLEGLGPLAR